jgi:ATP-dependent DNA helicase RecG
MEFRAPSSKFQVYQSRSSNLELGTWDPELYEVAMPSAPADPLQTPLTRLWGVGPERAAQLARLRLHTVEDLLLHKPRRHEDRRKFACITSLKEGESATARGRVVACGIKRWKRGARAMFECILEDGGGRLHLRWWQAYPWMEEHYAVGREFMVFGKVVSAKPRTMDHPETELIEAGDEEAVHVNRIVPIYPATEGLTQRWLRGLVWRTLAAYEPQLTASEKDELQVLPVTAGTKVQPSTFNFHPAAPLPSRAAALRTLHFPDELDDVEAARQRLALDEFLELQLAIQTRRQKLQANAAALPCSGNNRLMKPFLQALGFTLTGAQARVLKEIRRDLGGRQPMRRLLQGDVGAGKTVVAACAALMSLESGFNAALMAPTEILAGQHFRNFIRWFEPLGVKVELQTGSRKTSSLEPRTLNLERRGDAQLETRNSKPATLFVGTHALIEDAFAMDRLGLVVIDEQHKFGVAQRERLVRKGRYPHLLVMTATPIPRTLGLTLYGDLDVSALDELPAGRGRVRTFVRAAERLPKVWEFTRDKLARGRQAYVVYPRVDEADTVAGIKAVTEEFARVAKALAPHRAGLLHGRLGADEKERVMAAFRKGDLQVLLATSVIEVGVDVPNATVMVIENAEQFGLAQLHQLRGRIGRGAHESFCILVADIRTEDARQRLKVLEETSDGFKIAEADLQLRGPGELLGRDQSGLPSFRFGDLAKDRALVEAARELAARQLAAK